MKKLIFINLAFLQTDLVYSTEQELKEQKELFEYIAHFNDRAYLRYIPQKSVFNKIDTIGHVQSDSLSSKGMRPLTFAAVIKGSRELFIFLFKHGADPDFIEDPEPDCQFLCFAFFYKEIKKPISARWQIRAFLHNDRLKVLHNYVLEILSHLDIDNNTKSRTWRAMALGVQSNQPKKDTIIVVPDEPLTYSKKMAKMCRKASHNTSIDMSISLAELNNTDNDIIPLVD